MGGITGAAHPYAVTGIQDESGCKKALCTTRDRLNQRQLCVLCLIAGGEPGIGLLAGAKAGHLDDLGILLHLVIGDGTVTALVVDSCQKLHRSAASEFKPLKQKARPGQGEKTLFLYIHPVIRNTQPVTEGKQPCTQIQLPGQMGGNGRCAAIQPDLVPDGGGQIDKVRQLCAVGNPVIKAGKEDPGIQRPADRPVSGVTPGPHAAVAGKEDAFQESIGKIVPLC